MSGCPGVGKSTLCYSHWADKSVTWDGLPLPAHWREFADEITKLLMLIRDHPSFEAMIRMLNRSARKMATIERAQDNRTFFQSAMVQRLSGIGWRLRDLERDVNLIRPALRVMSSPAHQPGSAVLN